MYCPTCSSLSEVEVNFKSDGYTRNLYECGHCGAVWAIAKEKTVVIREGADAATSHS
jgi:uncharacterized Zn finger protein